MPSMDYNPRMSVVRGSQSSQQKQKKEDDGDAFMTLVRAHDNDTTRADH